MFTRRNFIKTSSLGLVAPTAFRFNMPNKGARPIVVSTWNHGMQANEQAWKVLDKQGKALDAVEKGVIAVENDPSVKTVGYGAYPDRDGNITLDACIMNERNQCGSVAFLQHIKNPIAVARLVMEKTPHVMLVGEGALHFALENGFKKQNLLTEEALTEWQEMFQDKPFKPKANIENHDTVGTLALDQYGNLSGACTTSGAANKMFGRVGDSPIIGAGLFVDNEVGGACATGWGEAVIQHAGSAMVVELMRQGISPQQACREISLRILNTLGRNMDDYQDIQVGFLALRKDGSFGAFALQSGFEIAIRSAEINELRSVEHLE